jgi:hypothetical protein
MASALAANEPVEEIKSLDDLRRLAEEVRTERKPRLVSIAGGGEITLAPVKPAKKNRSQMTPEEKEEADRQAFLSSAGALKGLFDAEEFKRQYRAARGSKRPPVDLSEFDERAI